MFEYKYIKTDGNNAVISRLTWPVWKLIYNENRAEWARAMRPEDPVKLAEQVFLSAIEKGDKIDELTITMCDDNYIKNMYNQNLPVNESTATDWARNVYETNPDYADELFIQNGANTITRPAILTFNVELKVDMSGKRRMMIDSKTYQCLYEYAANMFKVPCFITPFLMSPDTLLGEYADIIDEECNFNGEEFMAKERYVSIKRNKSIICVPIFVPEQIDSPTFVYKRLYTDDELQPILIRDPWNIHLDDKSCPGGDIRTTGITECIANYFGNYVKSVKPVKRFIKIDDMAKRAGLPYNGFYDAVKGELERIYAVNGRGQYAYWEL